ncbi:hypothetical protein V6Z12_D10G224800 [Gossypium hirsutum]
MLCYLCSWELNSLSPNCSEGEIAPTDRSNMQSRKTLQGTYLEQRD